MERTGGTGRGGGVGDPAVGGDAGAIGAERSAGQHGADDLVSAEHWGL